MSEVAATDRVMVRECETRYVGNPRVARTPIRNAKNVFDYLSKLCVGDLVENFYVLLLGGRYQLLGHVRVSRGTATASLVHPREVFREAIRESAVSIIIGHNHPSGDPTPSKEDDGLTRRIARGGKLLGIELLDHVVVGDGRYYSYRESGKFDDEAIMRGTLV